MSYYARRDAARARRNAWTAEMAKIAPPTFPAAEAMKAERNARISTEVDNDGRIIAATLPSRSNPHVSYRLERSPAGRWMHVDSTCIAWTTGRKCWHITTLQQLTEDME